MPEMRQRLADRRQAGTVSGQRQQSRRYRIGLRFTPEAIDTGNPSNHNSLRV